MDIEGNATAVPDAENVLEQEGVLKAGAKDFSALLDREIPLVRSTAAGGDLVGALEALFALEKTTRLGEDQPSTTRLLRLAAVLCVEARDWPRLKSTMSLLAKRRQQFRISTQRMVADVVAVLERTGDASLFADESTRVDLISHLLGLTDGKIFVENERAALTRMLAVVHEANGNLAEAARVLQSVQVETYGSMKLEEKIAFILEQMRLVLAVGEYHRALILSRKISAKALGMPEHVSLKIRFHSLMVRCYVHEAEYFSAYNAFRAIFDTLSADLQEKHAALRCMVVFLVLSEHSPEQSDNLRRLYAASALLTFDALRALLERMFTSELVDHAALLAEHRELLAEVFGRTSDVDSAVLFTALRTRVLEHNVRIVAEYYRCISLDRLAQFLACSVDETEGLVARMVNSKVVWARIDRSAGTVNFRKATTPMETRSEWGVNLNGVFALIERTCHLIDREIAVAASSS